MAMKSCRADSFAPKGPLAFPASGLVPFLSCTDTEFGFNISQKLKLSITLSVGFQLLAGQGLLLFPRLTPGETRRK